MLARKSLALVASTTDSSPIEHESDSPTQALLEVSPEGLILWADAEAAAWWVAPADAPLTGRAFRSLFAESRDGEAAAAWAALLEKTRGDGARLTAAGADEAFAARVQLTPKGEPDAQGRDSFIAAIDRSAVDAPAPDSPPATRRRPVLEPLPGVDPAATDDLLLADDLPEDDEADDSDAASDETPTPDDDEADEIETKDDVDETPDPDVLRPLPSLTRRMHFGATAAPPVSAADTPSIEAALAGARVGFFHIDFVSGITRFSEGWKGLLGYEGDDVADEASSLASLIHPDDSEASPLTLAHTGPFSAELRLRAKDDSWRWMILEGVCSPGDDGKPATIAGVMLDTQERHDADEETARNEERFLHLTGRGTAGCIELDLTQDQAWYSPEFRRALGRRADELGTTPEGFCVVLPPADAQVGLAAFFHSVSRGLPALVTRYALVHADGREIEFDALLTIRRNRRGVIEHICAVQVPAGEIPPGADAAAAAPAAPAVSGLAAAVQAALDAALEPIVLVDPNGLILHVNTRAAMLAGAEPDRLATRSFHEVFKLVLRATGEPASQLLEAALRSNQPLELDQSCQFVGREGPEDVAISCRPVFDEQRRLTSASVVLRRLAEMPLTQAELVKSNRMEALGRLACGIVHDFNNLLTTVVGGVSLAIDKRDLSPLETALKACTNAKNLARQLLTFARGDVTGRRVQSLNDIIRETARMAGAGSRTNVTLELSPDLYPVNVVTSQLVQVFTNLILNAMQVMPQGGKIWVRTHNMPLGQVNSVDLPAGDYVRADVQDNGPGIPPENLARIFEPFFTTRAEGTGLGLAMVNSIVAQHEGAIEASSTVGAGTTFTLYFPRAQTEAVQEAPQKLAMAFGTGRILVMDDDADLCAIASGMLEMLGYQADTATTAEDAIARFRKVRELGRGYSAVILDLTMAGGPGGEEVVGRLREIDPDVKAIVSSGYATDENQEHYTRLGFVATLSKPYRSGDLGRVLKEVLGTPPPGG